MFLFTSDICGESPRLPRHARNYADFAGIYATIREERVRALGEFRADVASGAYRMKDIVTCLSRELGRRTLPVRLPGQLLVKSSEIIRRFSGRQGWAQRVHSTLDKWLRDDIYDATRLREQLNWEPFISLEEGLADEVRWYRENESSSCPMSKKAA